MALAGIFFLAVAAKPLGEQRNRKEQDILLYREKPAAGGRGKVSVSRNPDRD